MDGRDDRNAPPQVQQMSPRAAEAPQEVGGGSAGGVLLYYKYVDLGEERRPVIRDWYLERCGAEGLRGR